MTNTARNYLGFIPLCVGLICALMTRGPWMAFISGAILGAVYDWAFWRGRRDRA